ncbi:mechanosensitive ion channel family protein [Winogradskyella arenosi]|uniref:Small-conductance mechanosensitive channel n=1 Tax=Winogradskyella arenosi TaxID=533325 RepID=A0A368ZGH7_9FLAO|nr:mechanosensitive ion channel domain-containing protein [Winogradskyella arenosi]RCW92592.1 small-conductance mechanosensitive channel [Winogradskyella arenosi]
MKRSLQLIICISLILIFFNIEGIINVIATMTNNEGFESSILVPQRNNFLIICFAWLLIILLRKGKALFLKRYDINAEDNLEARKMYTQINLLEKIVIFIIGLFAVGFILLSFNSIKKIGYGIFASAGLAGIIIGLSAQKVVGALLAGIQIAFTQPFRIDDAVVVENEWGWIEEINLTYVVIRLWDKRRLVLPSTYFLENPFQNWTRTSADIIGSVFLHTDYHVPFDELRQALTTILENSPLWDKQVNVLQVTDSKADSVEIRILVSAKNSPTAWDLRVHVREKMIDFIQKNYPQSLPRTRVYLEDKKATSKPS